MPEMPSEHRVKTEYERYLAVREEYAKEPFDTVRKSEAEAFRLGFFLGASAFYGSRHNSSSPVAVKHKYIKHEWDRLARLGSIDPDYVRILADSASSEEVD